MALFPPQDENAIFTSRTDVEDPLSSFSEFGFELDDAYWPTVEHYFQAMKFEGAEQREKIRQARTAKVARRMGRTKFKRIRSDWNKIREVMMTRAVYIKCHTHPSVAEQLLATGEKRIVERSMYDYYWGCGRDGRGTNTYGKILMNVRQKLAEERANT